ncbi:methyl-accepting chemotaxis protein [Scytonema millei]|uniref:Methyl-accepting chemotaxis protein n=1 Tax=Scytonema millei VB511283 TaxID=1245923 RepID=A0A9X5E013_9CYAN|nr:methyl-accepting chemotaxis protein [Scytonema millei]NHC33085.1 methyl-accepting chemotaxis protein [Scytonema millei VB511283]
MKLSLTAKAIAFSIALGTLPAMAIGVSNYISASNNYRQNAIQSQESLAFSLADKVGRFMFERAGDIRVISRLPILNNPEGTKEITQQQRQNVLDGFMRIYGVYDSIAVMDLSGKVILRTTGETSTNLADRDYFKEVIRTKQIAIIQPRKSSNGEVTVHLAAPIINANTGKMIGVVRARMPVKSLDSILNEKIFNASQQTQQVGSSSKEYHLISSDEKFFAAREAEQVGRDAKEDFASFVKMHAEKKMATAIDIDRLDKSEQLVSYAPVPNTEGMPELNWSVILAEDTKSVFAGQQQLITNLLLGTGITLLVAGGLAVLFASRTAKMIQQIANAVASSSTEIGATVEQQERTTTEQASSVNQTTVTVEELGAASRQSAEQAEASAAGARQALELADNGSKAVHQTMAEMSTVRDKVGAIAEQIMRLSEQTTQIGSISDLVADVANQTNMLALNAAVEAARAGEHGKGFGVVAGEIRKLADQSKKSAEKINALVNDIQASINSTVMATDEGTKSVDYGLRLAQGTVESFTGVADAVNHVFLNSQQISLSAKQQAVSVQQVVSAMNEINLGAKDTAAGINQVRVSTQQLNQVAQQLQAIV